MLSDYCITEDFKSFLLSRKDYKPFPTIEERNKWDELPNSLKEFWIHKGEKLLNYSWPTITATEYMDYSRTGDRVRYDTVSWKRRQDLAALIIAECMEDQDRFMDDIINGIWCICEETFWGIPGNAYMMKRLDCLPDVNDQIIELFSAETAALLAWTYFLLKNKLDSVSIMICERIQLEVKKRILDPYLNRIDFWWMGFNEEKMLNNWNPWCNSNCLCAFLLLEEDPQRRIAAVEKVVRSLENYIQRLPSDGGCEEGPKYWMYAGGKLFDCLELLYGASDGKIDIFQEPLIKRIGSYLYKAFIDDRFYANFADSSAKVHIPAVLAYRFGRRIGDAKLSELGSMVLKKNREEETTEEFASMFRILPALFKYKEIENHTGESPYIRDAWLDGIQMMVAREQQDSSKGLYLAAKGGHNAESHNHNDIGSFIVYCDGAPMIIDPGVLTYTSKSFFSERYTIWAMQSAYHNLPIVDGVQQKDGRQYKADNIKYHQEDTMSCLSMNISGAYPETSNIKSWIRSMSLIRTSHPCIEIRDCFQLKSETENIALILMTPHIPQVEKTGSIVLQHKNCSKVIIEYSGEIFKVSTDKILLEDHVMREVWGNELYRIKLKSITPADQGEYIIRISKL
jgi:hypothetical protein